MHSTFTGVSGRQRNVNLSGQKNRNPWSSTSWSPSTVTGTSKSVADANKQREERQQQRDRLRAALRLQKLWRGCRVRATLRNAHRQALDELYSDDSILPPDEKLLQASPLLFVSFQASHPSDLGRLALVTDDLLRTNFSCFQSGAIHPTRLAKLCRILVAALEKTEPSHRHGELETFLRALAIIIQRDPRYIEPILADFYKALAVQCRRTDSIPPDLLDLVRRVTVAPLSPRHGTESFQKAAYIGFAWHFLAQPDLELFQENIKAFVADVDLDRLSDSLLSPQYESKVDTESRLWLVAHFINIQRAKVDEALHLLYLKALYINLSTLLNLVRDGIKAAPSFLPQYVLDQLRSLPDAVEIENLLEKFTLNHGGSSASGSDDASFLAGYILSLVYCFPESGDDIRMRLYLADIETSNGRIPAIKFFWDALTKSAVFPSVLSNEDATLRLLQQPRAGGASAISRGGTQIEQEWRTVLLFLELYIFVLRLTDDEDFFQGLQGFLEDRNPPSRIRASTFSLQEVKRLSLFLRNLGFTLHWNGSDIWKHGQTSGLSSSMDSTAASSTRRSASALSETPSLSVATGIDFLGFRDTVTTAVRMIYERDSRRRFLPENHWLMTSKFGDMESFLDAVVLEVGQQQKQRDENDDESDGADDMMEVDDSRRFFSLSGHHQSIQARLEIQKRQRKATREREMRAAGPRLSILRNMPFVIPFNIRVEIFRQFVHLDKDTRRQGYIDPDQWRMAIMSRYAGLNPFDPNSRGREALGKHHGEIKRGQLFSDAMKAFYELGDGLKEPIQITFVDKFGTQEAGIDGGGVTKEFLTSVTNEAFGDDRELFVTNKNNAYFPNPCAMDQLKESMRERGIHEDSQLWRENVTSLLRRYEFLGRIIGKCMYEGILIDIVFAGFFLLKWTSDADTVSRTNINDLHELDEELYQGMLRLKNFDGDVQDLSLDFTIDDQVSQPGRPLKTLTRNLLPNGEDVLVDNRNRPRYISYVARHRLVTQPGPQTRAFLKGLTTIIDPAWLRMFNQSELQWLVGGDNSEIDVEDLRAHTDYSGPYAIGDDGEEHPTVKLFWQVMHELEDSQRRDVLKYVTSTPRAPLLGFSQLQPKFTIRFGGPDQERLPSASTCVNLLKLPAYENAALLKSKLLYAVQAGAGFDLS